MARRLDIWLNGVSLRDVDQRIIIREIHDNPAQIETVWGANPGRNGQRLISLERSEKTIGVEFAIREVYDIGARQAVLEAVNRWAAEGWLKSSTHPGKRIYVVPTNWPALENARDYTDTYSLTLTANASPFWEDEHPVVLSASGTSGSGTLINLGSMAAYPEVTVTPSASTMTGASVTVGDTLIELTGLSVAAGDSVTIRHDERGFLRIEADGVSVLGARTTDSDDELIALPGANGVAFETDAAAAVTVALRGRYK